MFQFTREFIINSDITFEAKDNFLCVEGIANYEKGVDKHGVKRIMSFIEVDHVAETVPVLVIDLESKNYDQRLEIIAELYRATEGSYANYLKARMSKSFLFEIPAGSSVAEAAKIINDAIRAYDSYYFTVVVPEAGKENAGKLVITGVEGNQRLFFNLWKSNGQTSKHEAQWELADECNDHEGANIGKRGFGTYDLLIQNNRLPVPEKTGYFSPSKHEMPWPNVEYDMVEFDYNSGIRNIGGSGVVGSYERSVTTHKFWVNKKLREDATSKWHAFEAALKVAAGVAEAEEPEEPSTGGTSNSENNATR